MTEPLSEQAAGLEAVFLENRPTLMRRARAMGAGDDAEDVLQDVWFRLRAAQGPIANPQGYLNRMIYTAILDRRRGSRRAASRDHAWLELAEDLPGGGASPAAERSLMARQTLQAVAARLEALGEPAASIFRRHRIEGESQKVIAQDLRMGLSTVEKHLRRAYAAILDLRAGDEA